MVRAGDHSAAAGVTLGRAAVAQFVQIATDVGRTSEVMADVVAVAEQQAEGVAQMTTALDRLSGGTQLTAGSAQESAGAAAQLSGQAVRLQGVVGGFRLGAAEVRGRNASARRS